MAILDLEVLDTILKNIVVFATLLSIASFCLFCMCYGAYMDRKQLQQEIPNLKSLRNKKKKGAVNKIPPPITKINEASQLRVILRNPITFSGFVIPEIIKPTPKILFKCRYLFMAGS